MTLEDVALAAGVSPKTVSRVLNNEPNVRQSTREKVLAVAKQMGYRPNPAARSLASSKTYTIAHLHANSDLEYIARVNAGIYRACREHNYMLILESLDQHMGEPDERIKEILTCSRIEGVVLSPPTTDWDRLVELLLRRNIPIVSISPGVQRKKVPSVAIHERRAAAAMTRHLIHLGHRSIGYIAGPPEHGSATARKEGFLEAIDEGGLQRETCPIEQGDFSFRSGLDTAANLLAEKNRPTAIFAANDVMAAGAMTAAYKLGLSVPGDVSIAGFDASHISSVVWPPLATVRQPVGDMAETAAHWLITGELLKDEAARHHEFEFELIDRASAQAR